MSAVVFLAELSRQGVKVWADGDQLRCRAPKGVLTTAIRSELAAYKTELLTLLSQSQAHNPIVSLPSVLSAPLQRYLPFPTTDVQQAYWIGRGTSFELGNVGNHGYIEVEAVEMNMVRSFLILKQLIGRHEMLRAIMLPDGQQQILEHVPPFQIESIDLEGLAPQAVAEQLAQIRQEMDHQVFQVEQWPAFAIRLTRLSKQRVRVHLSIESLFTDVWSIRVLIQEFLHLYHEPEAPLPTLELSFRDYMLAEVQLQESEQYRRSQEYWTGRLHDLPPAPELPLAIDPALLPHPRFVPRKAHLDARHWYQLKARGAQAGLTPSGILLAAFAEVLSTWSKTPRFCLNLTIFNRFPLHEQVNEILGDFTSLLLLAVDTSLPVSFEQRARRLQEQLWRDFDHRYYSGVRVLRDLAHLQGNSAQAIMPVVFTSLLGQEASSAYAAPWQETTYCVTQSPQVWLDHQVMEEAGSLILYWQAVEALFPDGLLDAMFEAYLSILHTLATDDAVWHRRFFPLIPASQRNIRAQINATQAPVSDQLLHSFFLEQAAKRPNQLAVISPTRRLTYQETLSEALLLAQQVRRLGARPNRLVAVVMEKGWEQVVGVLGVLLSGAAYLPIDPKVPHERLCFLLEHGEVEVVVTQSWVEQRLSWPEHLHRLCVDALDALDGASSDGDLLAVQQGAEDLAYVIYTSGSTGVPKGVMIDHRAAVNTILEINERFAVGSQDRVLALSALHFDLSVYDFFGVLAAGGTIVLPAEEAWRNPAAWMELLVQEQVTLWNTVPALLEMLVEYADAHADALRRMDLRLVLLSGDWIAVTLPDRVRTHIPQVEIVSLGGATEASIWSICYPITEVDPSWKSIPYGRPLRNQGFQVLNAVLEPCPVWVPGDLYIAGIGLARGYWRDEEKTQANFIVHPRSGERFYRTGDVGRYLPDGTIEFLGREDFQVKILGHRIELGEIEAVLERHGQVSAAVVVVQKGRSSGQQLWGYVVSKGAGTEVSGQALRKYLQEKLPEYMVPVQVVVLEALPLTSNGKVDRQALPMPEEQETAQKRIASAVGTPIEEILTAIWCELLERSSVGRHDNFFALGGHSLLVMQLLGRVRESLKVDLAIRMLFEAPTVAEFAQRVELALCQEGAVQLPPLVAMARPEVLPLSYTQQRLWFLDQLHPESATYLSPSVLRLRGILNAEALEQSLQELVCRHEILRTNFVIRAGHPIQIIHPVSRYCLPFIDLERLEPEEREKVIRQLAQQEACHPCNLEQGPLLRVYLLQLTAWEHVVLLTLHHIITDGWSNQILIRELTTLYRAFMSEQPSPLAPLPIQYADYALWQRQWLQGEVLQKHMAYWLHRLKGASALELPTDIPRTAIQSDRGARYSFMLPTELSAQLVSFSRQEGVTLFMLLLATFQVLLYRLTGQTDIVVGTDVANRVYVETESLIGFFVNLLALRIDIQRSLSFRNLLQYVRAIVLGAYTHQEIPFDLVVESLAVERNGKQAPLVQILFVLQNIPEREESLPGVELEMMESVSTAAKFDLALFLQEGSDGIKGSVVYRDDLFKQQTIATWMRRLEMVLRDVVARPDIPVDDLETSTDEEKTGQANTEKELHEIGTTIWRRKKSEALDLAEFHSLLMKQDNE